MDLQMERSELLMKPRRTAEENKRLAELVANENDWEMPLENVRKEYLEWELLLLCTVACLSCKSGNWRSTKKTSTSGTTRSERGSRRFVVWDNIPTSRCLD